MSDMDQGTTQAPDQRSSHPGTEPASPLPWEVVAATDHHGAYIVSASGLDVCDLYAMSNPLAASVRNGGNSYPIPFTDMDANARLIVHAVNSHDDLVQSLRVSTTMLEALLVQLNSWGHESAVNARGQIWRNEELLRGVE